MRRAAVLSWSLVMSASAVAAAQQAPASANPEPRTAPAAQGGGSAPLPGSAPHTTQPLPAAPPSEPSGPAPFPEASQPAPATAKPVDASGYQPEAPAASATTHPQPTEQRVWRLVDPTEHDWHAPDADRPRGWFRVDIDRTGTSGYVGGSFRLADGLALAPFAWGSDSSVQPNLALTWQLGGLWVMPAVGTTLDFQATRAVSLDPQLFAALDVKVIYLEVWAQFFLGSVYHSSSDDSFEGRAMLLFSLSSALGVGAEYDPSFALSETAGSALYSSIIGGRVNLRIGDRSTAGLFVGYQTVSRARDSSEGIAGRLEFVQQW